jgi:hypothetical protein
MDSSKCQTATATPAEPGELPYCLEVYVDGTQGVIGYHLLGPGADSEWLHGSIQEAETAARNLNAPYPAAGG